MKNAAIKISKNGTVCTPSPNNTGKPIELLLSTTSTAVHIILASTTDCSAQNLKNAYVHLNK